MNHMIESKLNEKQMLAWKIRQAVVLVTDSLKVIRGLVVNGHDRVHRAIFNLDNRRRETRARSCSTLVGRQRDFEAKRQSLR
jgi:hypothetical protein